MKRLTLTNRVENIELYIGSFKTKIELCYNIEKSLGVYLKGGKLVFSQIDQLTKIVWEWDGVSVKSSSFYY